VLQSLRAFALGKASVTESLACKGTVIQNASFKVNRKAFLGETKPITKAAARKRTGQPHPGASSRGA
jgi:hypothetical protein